jgi:SAM-dependent methyltransferase
MTSDFYPMSKTIQRFSTRVDNYVKFRPGYPPGVLDQLTKSCGLESDSIVADVGSGTGILSELFLRKGNQVFGVEPNEPMRTAAEQFLKSYDRFVSIEGTAEQTRLATHSVDLITAGQAFHWFDPAATRIEFTRILKPGGWVALIWNERRLASTPFLRDYEALLLRYGTDYTQVRHENVRNKIGEFFSPGKNDFARFDNVQGLDLESLKGRLFSASYTPEPGHPNFEPMLAELTAIFAKHANHGLVDFEYDTTLYYGKLVPRPA